MGWASHIRYATDTGPRLLQCTVDMSYLTELDLCVVVSTGSTLEELAETDPRDAYAHVSYLFRNLFIEPWDSYWDIRSPEKDGEQAYQGLVRYTEEEGAPDLDVEEVDIVLSVWKRTSLFNRLRGKGYQIEDVIRFRAGPQDLAIA